MSTLAVTKASRMIARRASVAIHETENAPIFLPPETVVEIAPKEFKKSYRLPGDVAMMQSLSKSKPLKQKQLRLSEKLILDIFETSLRLEFKKQVDSNGKVTWERPAAHLRRRSMLQTVYEYHFSQFGVPSVATQNYAEFILSLAPRSVQDLDHEPEIDDSTLMKLFGWVLMRRVHSGLYVMLLDFLFSLSQTPQIQPKDRRGMLGPVVLEQDDPNTTRQTRLVLAKSVQAVILQQPYLVRREYFVHSLKPFRIALGEKKKEMVAVLDFDHMLWGLICAWEGERKEERNILDLLFEVLDLDVAAAIDLDCFLLAANTLDPTMEQDKVFELYQLALELTSHHNDADNEGVDKSAFITAMLDDSLGLPDKSTILRTFSYFMHDDDGILQLASLFDLMQKFKALRDDHIRPLLQFEEIACEVGGNGVALMQASDRRPRRRKLPASAAGNAMRADSGAIGRASPGESAGRELRTARRQRVAKP